MKNARFRSKMAKIRSQQDIEIDNTLAELADAKKRIKEIEARLKTQLAQLYKEAKGKGHK